MNESWPSCKLSLAYIRGTFPLAQDHVIPYNLIQLAIIPSIAIQSQYTLWNSTLISYQIQEAKQLMHERLSNPKNQMIIQLLFYYLHTQVVVKWATQVQTPMLYSFAFIFESQAICTTGLYEWHSILNWFIDRLFILVLKTTTITDIIMKYPTLQGKVLRPYQFWPDSTQISNWAIFLPTLMRFTAF